MPGNTALLHDIGRFSPLNRLNTHQLAKLTAQASIARTPPGVRLFQIGEDDHKTIYLLTGQVSLIANDGVAANIHAGEQLAYKPIAPGHPRQATALTTSSVTTMSLDNEALHQALLATGRQGAGTYADRGQITTTDGGSQRNSEPSPELIFAQMDTPLLKHLPRTHLEILKNRVRAIKLKTGEQIIREGTPANDYYMIADGCCRLSHHRRHQGQSSDMGTRQQGTGLGEEALIEGTHHKNTITTMKDSVFLRMDKGEFLTLLVRPYLHWVTIEEATQSHTKTAAILLDVRSTRVFQNTHIAGSINLPLHMLHQTTEILDAHRPYIICCESPKRAMTASFMLAERGIRTSILEGGVRSYCCQ